ncbi:MAG TPA: hypothetical protein VMG11_09750 [Steroidobacteraceae bacterium]|nr:hypothetical protein [Steroidobacteraceae bacterium]
MSAVRDEVRAANLRTVSALALLFLLPLIGAFWLYYGAGWRPAGHINHGELIEPVIQLPDVSLPQAMAGAPIANVFMHHWTIVYVGDGRCADSCRRALFVMRQARFALNNDMTRVQRVFLVTGECCDRAFLTREHPGLTVLDASTAKGSKLLAKFPPSDLPDSLFVVDPLGNLMMRYDSRRDLRGLLEDLKRLLQLSHIG